MLTSPTLKNFWCRHSRKPWTKFINVDNQHLAVPEVNSFSLCWIRFVLSFSWSLITCDVLSVGYWLRRQVAALWSPGKAHCKRSNGKILVLNPGLFKAWTLSRGKLCMGPAPHPINWLFLFPTVRTPHVSIPIHYTWTSSSHDRWSEVKRHDVLFPVMDRKIILKSTASVHLTNHVRKKLQCTKLNLIYIRGSDSLEVERASLDLYS